jgi:hypothetical protein
MSQFTCEQITEAVKRADSLKETIDLALFKFDPEDGTPALEEAKMILKEFDYIFPGSKEFYEYFRNNIGDERLLKSKTTSVPLGGKTISEMRSEFADLNVKLEQSAQDMLRDMEEGKGFSYSNEIKKMNLIMIRPRYFGLDGFTTLGEFYQKAINAGLYLCPPEVGVRYALQSLGEKHWPGSVALERFGEAYPIYRFFAFLGKESGSTVLGKFENDETVIQSERTFLFSLDDPRKDEGK